MSSIPWVRAMRSPQPFTRHYKPMVANKTASFANALGAVVAGRTGATPDWTFKDVSQALSGPLGAKRSTKQKKRQSRIGPYVRKIE